jgi:ferrochelatase
VLGFGGPEGHEDVLPFLENVTRGRGIPRERLAAVAEHYHHFGGVSPINEQNKALVAALEGAGIGLPVYWGNRNWAPYVEDTWRQMATDGVQHAYVLATSAYASFSGCRQYHEDVARARVALESDPAAPAGPTAEKLPHYFDARGFVRANAEALAAAIATLPEELRDTARLVATAHSIPVAMAAVAGPQGGAYEAELLAAAQLAVDAAAPGRSFDLVWQSRSGPPSVPWLEPDINDHLRALAAAGEQAVVVFPIGFISDHLEVIWDLDNEAAETAALEDARDAASKLWNAHRDNIAITTSFTEALGQVAWWLRPEAGTNVVSIDMEFPSVTYPWFRVGAETGAEVRLVKALEDPASLSEEDVAALVDDNTSVICVSHVQYATGHRLDPGALAELAHAHDAKLVLDATQSAGMVPTDVTESGADVVIAGSYKWLCSTFGAAICYLTPELRERFEPPFVGWRSTTDPYTLDAANMSLATEARRMEFSTMAYGAGVALAAAMEYVLEMDTDAILEHDLALAAQLMSGLDELGAQVLTPREDHRRGGTVTARFPGRDSERVAGQLNERGVIVSPRFGSTRFSAHFFNDGNDVARALDVLSDVLASPGD